MKTMNELHELGKPREVLTFSYELEHLESKGFSVQHVTRLIDTFPFWKRALSVILWKPRFLKRRLGAHFVNPYAALLATIVPPDDAAIEAKTDNVSPPESDDAATPDVAV